MKTYLDRAFQKNRMTKLYEFSLSRVHANCLGFLCDTHLYKKRHGLRCDVSKDLSDAFLNKENINFVTFAILSDLMLSKHFFK